MTPLLLLAAAAAPSPYHALGTEPFWSLEIGGGLMRLEEAGRATVTTTAPVARPSFNGHRYVARTMTVDVTHAPCSDGMSDRRYPDTVTVQMGRRVLRGCGGAAVAAAQVAGDWRLTAIDGRPVRLTPPATVRFAGRRVEGRVCNGFSAVYSEGDGVVRIGVIRATRMFCAGEPGRVEARLFALAAAPLTPTTPLPDTLVLTGRGGSMTLTRAR